MAQPFNLPSDPVPPPERTPRSFSLQARVRSFGYAFNGLALLLRSQPNAWIHAAATAAAVTAGFVLGITPLEWCAVVLAMALVWTAEALNTALEFLADEVSLAPRKCIGRAKDLGAGAVLLSSIGAAAVGAIVFLPRLLNLFGYP